MKAIYCAGEQGRVVLDVLQSTVGDETVIFLDDDPSLHGEVIHDTKVIGELDKVPDEAANAVQCVVAFGNKKEVRLQIAEDIEREGYQFFNAIHPSVVISEQAILGNGLMINGQSYIGPDVVIEDHVLIDSCVSVSHGTTLENGATITPGTTLAGGVTVRTDGYIGPGATIAEDLSIGQGAVVGAGSTVIDDVPSETVVVGSPANPI
jgi:sugar O-acyltransferase (sialic acid O-acetyltransferase NeuD family)